MNKKRKKENEVHLSSLEEIRQKIDDSSSLLWNMATALNRQPKIYMHWTNTPYGKFDEFCHINIDKDGNYYLSRDRNFGKPKEHTWKRGEGAIDIALSCAEGATIDNIGEYPPTIPQLKALSRCLVVLTESLNIPINKQHILTGGEAAANEDGLYLHPCYSLWHNETNKKGCWELEYLGNSESPSYNPDDMSGMRGGDVIRKHAIWHQKSGGII